MAAAGGKRNSNGSDNRSARKKAKVEPKRGSLTIKTGVGDEEAAVAKISEHYGFTKKEAKGVFDLARTLQQDDPGIFITFRTGAQVRAGLQRGGGAVAAHRPCNVGADGAAALTNIKAWVAGLVTAPPVTVTPVCDQGLALGNMDQDTFNATAMALSFAPNPLPNQWAIAVLASGVSLGSLVSIFGTGRGAATIGPMPSAVFFG